MTAAKEVEPQRTIATRALQASKLECVTAFEERLPTTSRRRVLGADVDGTQLGQHR